MMVRFTLSSAVAALAVFGFAAPTDLRKNDAVPIRLDQDLRVETSRPGDQFTAHVDGDRRLPAHTVLYGVIDRIYPATRFRAAAMDLEFTSLQTPDGARYNIDAIPMRPDDPHLTRVGDGRVISGYQPGTEGAYVAGGAIGGAIIGSIAHRPFTGTFLGAVIGAIAGSANRHDNQNLIASKNTKLMAVLQADVPPAGQPLPPPPTPPNRPALHYVSIRYQDRDLTFGPDVQPFELGQVVMVPISAMAGQLDLHMLERFRGRIALEGEEGRVLLFENSSVSRTNGVSATLPHDVIRRNGILYAPLEAFESLKGENFSIKD